MPAVVGAYSKELGHAKQSMPDRRIAAIAWKRNAYPEDPQYAGLITKHATSDMVSSK